jgi:SAM-dependent methyltransferase
MTLTKSPDGDAAVTEQVRARYADAARAVLDQRSSPSDAAASCCGPSGDAVFGEILYSADERAALPDAAVLASLGCGNPTAVAELRPGEVVLDLGSGGGIDVLLSAQRVGPTGFAYGIDMTDEMLELARSNASAAGATNVEFRKGHIESIPLDDASVDVVISNCVINLSPDKAQVWREIARVLKPGGRVAVSDLALLRPLPAEVVAMVEAWIGCIAGAVLVDETERMAREVGLESIVLRKKPEYVRALQSFEDPLYQRIVEHLPAGAGAEAYLTSLDVEAHKPGKAKACCG